MNIFIRSLIFVTTFLIINIFGFMNASASTNENYNISSGVDNSDGLNDAFLSAENLRLGSSDNDRVQSNGNWPIGNYDESKYIEFVFSPSVPSGAIIEAVTISHEYYQSVKLTAAKLEVWNGNNFVDYPINLPVTSGTASEISETINIFNTVNTANLVNGLKVRFLAYRATTASSIKTSHDLMNLNVTYSIPEIPPPVVVEPENESPVDPAPEIIPEPQPEIITEPEEPSPEIPTEEIPEVVEPPIEEILPEEELIPEETPVENIPPTAQPQETNLEPANPPNNNGAVPFFMLGTVVNPENKTPDTVSVSTNVNTEPTLPPVQEIQEVVTQNTMPVDTTIENSPVIQEFENIPDQKLENEPEIDPNLSLAAVGTVSSGEMGNTWWWILLLFAILGSYLAIRIRQKPKSQKL